MTTSTAGRPATRRALIVAALVAASIVSVSPVAGAKCVPTATKYCPYLGKKYTNCDKLRAVAPNGVARDAAAAGKSGAIVDLTMYRAHSGLDRDKDGIACER